MVLFLVLLWVPITSCAEDYDEEEMLILASALTKVTAAFDSYVRYGDINESASVDDLFKSSVEHDPGLLSPFANFHLEPVHHEGGGYLLMCPVDKSEALLADAGCTGSFDQHLWQTPQHEACALPADLPLQCK